MGRTSSHSGYLSRLASLLVTAVPWRRSCHPSQLMDVDGDSCSWHRRHRGLNAKSLLLSAVALPFGGQAVALGAARGPGRRELCLLSSSAH